MLLSAIVLSAIVLGGCTTALMTDEQNATRWIERGLEALEQSDFRSARQAFDKALELEPENYRALLGRARSELQLGDWPAALLSFQRALGNAPAESRAGAVGSFLNAIIDYARGLFERGEYDQSIALLREAQNIDEDARDDLARELLGTLDRYRNNLLEGLQGGELTEALDIVRRALKRFPADPAINELLRSLLRS
jgi:tetratricopeptide (TPR) repeat protein